ncbi:MAG: phosphatidate cytidylyltransferase [Candidatus Azosocius agrarius]|nr:MAG: phosphatidate cytidylyltransferase [Gammaproteobacteria bacterium]
MFIKRILTFIFLFFLFIKISIYSSMDMFLIFFLLISFVIFKEWGNLLELKNNFYSLYLIFVLFIFLFLLYFYKIIPGVIFIFFCFIFLLFHFLNLIYYYDFNDLMIKNYIINLFFSCFLFFPVLINLNLISNYFTNDFFIGKMIIIYIFFLIFISDTIGYIFGKSFGKKKIFKKISPNKTYFGIISIFVVVFLLYILLYLNKIFNSFYVFLILNFIVLISSIIGDLVISLYKRFHGSKDSGNFLPGHGGFLDRIDSSLLSFSMFLFFL